MNISEIQHPIPPVWNEQSRVLILGTMPSPKSREAGFFYMHPQNRFWSVMSAVFGEEFEFPNKVLGSSATDTTIAAAIAERRDFLLRHKLAMWDVLASCKIEGAADATIRDAVPNDFTQILESAKISDVFCTGKTAYGLWKKYCAEKYEHRYNLTVHCLPSTSPANAQWKIDKLIEEYKKILETQMDLSEKLNLDELIAFRLEANVNTYAAFMNETESTRLDSHDFRYTNGDYTYHDTYVGGEQFAGQEAIWKNGKSQYAMNYLGRVLAKEFSGNFLKEALRQADHKMPYRGPEYYQSGEYTYKCSVNGDFTWFQGYEEIYWHDQKVYECFFHGGVTKG